MGVRIPGKPKNLRALNYPPPLYLPRLGMSARLRPNIGPSALPNRQTEPEHLMAPVFLLFPFKAAEGKEGVQCQFQNKATDQMEFS